MNKITAIYVRSSLQKQENGHDAQKLSAKQYCARKNIKNSHFYEDFGITGTRSSRPSLNKLMRDCYDGKIEHIIVFSFSRFARSSKHLLEALETFNQLGIRFTSISEEIDTNTPIGKAMFVIISALSALERDILSERTKVGLIAARNRGKKLGRPKTRNSELINELSKRGYSQRKIAKLVGVSKTTVARELSGPKRVNSEFV